MRLPGFQLIIDSQRYLSITISNTFLPATSTLSCYNPLAISNMRFLSLFQLTLAKCSVCAFFLKKYTDVLADFLDFRYFYLIPPHFPTVSVPFVSLLLHCSSHYSTTRFLCAVDTHFEFIHIFHLQLREVQF